MISNKMVNAGNGKDFLKSDAFMNFKEMNYQLKALEDEKEQMLRIIYENGMI